MRRLRSRATLFALAWTVTGLACIGLAAIMFASAGSLWVLVPVPISTVLGITVGRYYAVPYIFRHDRAATAERVGGLAGVLGVVIGMYLLPKLLDPFGPIIGFGLIGNALFVIAVAVLYTSRRADAMRRVATR